MIRANCQIRCLSSTYFEDKHVIEYYHRALVNSNLAFSLKTLFTHSLTVQRQIQK